MLHLILTMFAVMAFGAVLEAGLKISIWLYVLIMTLLFIAGWFLQTNEEKDAMKRWWYDRL